MKKRGLSQCTISGAFEKMLALPSAMGCSLAVKGRWAVTGSLVYLPTPRNKAVRREERGQKMNK